MIQLRWGLLLAWQTVSQNMTGMLNFVGDLTPKRLELLKLTNPKLSRIALLLNPSNPYYGPVVPRDRFAAEALGMQLTVVDWNPMDDINTAFTKAIREGKQAIIIGGDIYHFGKRKQISEAAIKFRVPCIAPHSPYAEAGCLLTYGVSALAQYRQIASHSAGS